MAKKAILDVLENTIGRYVKNLDAESLNLAIWSGKIELQNLQLDTTSINSELAERAHDAPNFASPFRVINGHFEKLQLDVPWAKLGSKPVIFRAKGLFVRVEPHDFLKDEVAPKKEPARNAKGDKQGETSKNKVIQDRLDSIARADTARKSALAVRKAWEEKAEYTLLGEQIDEDSSSDQKSSFLSRLVRRIIENLQLEIEDVHLAMKGCDIAAGVVLKSLRLSTTDKDGNVKFVDRQTTHDSFLHKELLISGFGIYLQENVTSEGVTNLDYKQYILSPLSFEAKLRESDAANCVKYPKYLIHSKLQSLSIKLSRTQLELSHRLARVVTPSTKIRPLFPEYRPLVSVSDNAKKWWKYAFRCVGRLNRRRSWMEFYLAFQKRKKYLQLYKRHAYAEETPWLTELDESELSDLRHIEGDRSVAISGLMLWRSIADSEYEKEKERREESSIVKRSILSNIFGSSTSKEQEYDDVPITLSVDELSELEGFTLDADQRLTKDSKYCDITFVLGSFQVHIIRSEHEHISSLDMGMVSSSFKANADGSYRFALSMLSLEVSDKVTKNSFYPMVCHGLHDANERRKHAVHFESNKSGKGDQEVKFTMIAFETVASPLLIQAVKDFFDVSSLTAMSTPILEVNADDFSDALSDAIRDAWNGKNKQKQKWTLDMDVKAPILVVPENCTKPNAFALICNFGRFKVDYGITSPSSMVLDWFKSRQSSDKAIQFDVDHLKMEMNDLSFIINSVGEAAKNRPYESKIDVSKSVIRPLSFTLNIGIEQTVATPEKTPQTCIFGVLPSVELRLDPSQIQGMLRVAAQWTSYLHDFGGDTSTHESGLEEEVTEAERQADTGKSTESDAIPMDRMYMSMSLLRFSVYLYSHDGVGAEAHLVSVMASSLIFIDGSSCNRLRMGWFWILDRLKSESNLPRCQRLLLHSQLPKSAKEYASKDVYSPAIIEDLAKLGVFNHDYEGSGDLADIQVSLLKSAKAAEYDGEDMTGFSRDCITSIEKLSQVIAVNAKFTNLFINWNPDAMATFFEAKSEVLEFQHEATRAYEQFSALERRHSSLIKVQKDVKPSTDIHAMFISAKMGTFEMSLNASEDDLPLFILTMSDSKVSQNSVSGTETNVEVTFELGDFRVESYDHGDTLESYRCILGLSYSDGDLEKSKCKIFAQIRLSPMRFVYLHSQIFALIDYATEGVMGTMASMAASSATEAATEVTKSSYDGEQLFCIDASGFEIVLPQAAYSEKYFSLHSGRFNGHFRTLENGVGSKTNVVLTDFMLQCEQLGDMFAVPVEISITANMNTQNDASISIATSRIRILLAQCQYAQMIHTLDCNVGEHNTFLRGNLKSRYSQSTSTRNINASGISTYEVQPSSTDDVQVEKTSASSQQLMDITFKMEEFSLDLYGHSSSEDSILSLSALEAFFTMETIPKENLTKSTLSLKDLVCVDKRPGTAGREFRRVIGSNTDTTRSECNDAPRLFLLQHVYNSSEGTQEFEVKIGSSQIVVIPDLIAEMTTFSKIQEFNASSGESATTTQVIVNEDNPNEFESSIDRVDIKTTSNKASIETSNVQFVFVDLGSISSSLLPTPKKSSLTETIVFQGRMKATVDLTTEGANEEVSNEDFKLDSERIEIYTAKGANLHHPVQILEPIQFSLHLLRRVDKNEGRDSMDLKFATLAPVDISISMQNAALASAIAASLSEAFFEDSAAEAEVDEFRSLSEAETSKIELLNSALEQVGDIDDFNNYRSDHPNDISAHDGSIPKQTKQKLKLRVTLPSARITLINDFQGMDLALFKLTASHCVFGGEVDFPGLSDSESPMFGCNLNTSFLADYFDATTFKWEKFLYWCRQSYVVGLFRATKKATDLVASAAKDDSNKQRLSRSMAAHAARSLITTLPYAVENHSGINAIYSIRDEHLQLPSNSTRFFQFDLFPASGSGGMRKYGQDVRKPKAVTLFVGCTEIRIADIDSEAGNKRAYFISEYETYVFTYIVKRGNSTVLHLSSQVEMYNLSSLPFRIAIFNDDRSRDLGILASSKKDKRKNEIREGSEPHSSHAIFGLPAPLLSGFAVDSNKNIQIQLVPMTNDNSDLFGTLIIPPLQELMNMMGSGKDNVVEVSCSDVKDTTFPPLIASVRTKVSFTGDPHPFIQLLIEPRAIMVNKLPVKTLVRTPMPHTYQAAGPEIHADKKSNEIVHSLNNNDTIEIFTPGPSIALSMKCATPPVSGTTTGWTDGVWKIIPLGKTEKLSSQGLRCLFPFEPVTQKPNQTSTENTPSGIEVFILEEEDASPDFADKQNSNEENLHENSTRTLILTACNIAVDHIGCVLFKEECENRISDERGTRDQSSFFRPLPLTLFPLSAFSSPRRRRRISLLPRSSRMIRIIQQPIGDGPKLQSKPFTVSDVPLVEGIDSMPIQWSDNTQSGLFAYRELTAEGSEVHIIPEYIVFNGCNRHSVRIQQISNMPTLLDPLNVTRAKIITLKPESTSQIKRDKSNSIVTQLEIPDLSGITDPVHVDTVGLRICILKSKVKGEPIGSLAVQTVTGGKDSCLVIKIGALRLKSRQDLATPMPTTLIERDYLRFRIRWSEIKVTLKDTGDGQDDDAKAAIQQYLKHHNVNSSEIEKNVTQQRNEFDQDENVGGKVFPDVAQIILRDLMIDFQRMWDDNGPRHGESERSQLLVNIHNIRILDCSPSAETSLVFDSMSKENFFDLCVRTRGPLNTDLIIVDLIDLNLAYGDGKPEIITVSTSEDFVWRMLDLGSRVLTATAELAGVDLDLKWDAENGKFKVAISDKRIDDGDDLDRDDTYEPPRGDMLYEVRLIRVSPFNLLLSFKRKPQSSRYKLIKGVRGARLTNYFTTHLKFTIDKAELRFQGYMAKDMKGPPDRIFDTLKAVYMAQLRSKTLTLLSATNFQDWKYLAGRETGGDEYIRGDLLRVTGNLFGNLAGTIGGAIVAPCRQEEKSSAKNSNPIVSVGEGVGHVISKVNRGVTGSIQGAGDGIGSAICGVGSAITGSSSKRATGVRASKSSAHNVGSESGVEVTRDGPVEEKCCGSQGFLGLGGLFQRNQK
ncbi:hypothetical protein ACHAXS_009736 [Conticribra weissflogii]